MNQASQRTEAITRLRALQQEIRQNEGVFLGGDALVSWVMVETFNDVLYHIADIVGREVVDRLEISEESRIMGGWLDTIERFKVKTATSELIGILESF